jgi:GTP-binding protein
MEIHTADFVAGVVGDDYELEGLPQIAFFGRSNVGKSSLINSFVKRSKLTRTSATPGKTREANFYLINKSFYLVDFPGYGYAKLSQKERDRIARRMLWYLTDSGIRPALIVVIVDANVGVTEIDAELLRIVKEMNHPHLVVANKIDKPKRNDRKRIVEQLRNEHGGVELIGYSTRTGEGREQLIEYVVQALEVHGNDFITNNDAV